MCGICGFISGNAREEGALTGIVSAMSTALRHRGPDDSGRYIDTTHGVGFGHQRLSIIDLSGGHQPLADATQRYWIVFNGEIYNYKALRRQLQQCGHHFATDSDTEVILHAYMEWGEQCLQHLRGMFAFAIWDSVTQTLFCGRDRLGIKPFYYYWNGHTLVFASEIKAILQHPDVRADIDSQAVAEYLQLQYITAPKTVFKHIAKLPAGHSLRLENGHLNLTRYWQLPMQPVICTQQEAAEALRELLEEAVALHMISDVSLGAFLSGGADSSAVVGLMSQVGAGPIKTHTAVFDQLDHDESIYARQVAELFQTQHAESPVGMDLAGDLSTILWHLDEPFADASAVPSYYLSKATRERVKVSLSGDGGDELFCGYNWYSELARLQQIDQWLPSSAMKGLGKAFASILPQTLRGTTFLNNLGEPGWRQHYNLRTFFTEAELQTLLTDAPAADGRLEQYYQDSHSQWPGVDRVKAAQLVDMQSYMVEDILMKIDKTSMAHGLEVRVPLLDHKVVEYAANLPTGFHLQGERRKCVLKNSVRDIVPAALMDRKKHGFSAPVAQWLLNDLNELAGDLLLSPNTQRSGLFNQKAVADLWGSLRQGRGHVGIADRCWAVLCFELWYATFSRQSKN